MDRALVRFSCHNDFFRFRVAELHALLAAFAGDGPAPRIVAREFETADAILAYAVAGSEAANTHGDDRDVVLAVELPPTLPAAEAVANPPSPAPVEQLAAYLVKNAVLVKEVVRVYAEAANYADLRKELEAVAGAASTGAESPGAGAAGDAGSRVRGAQSNSAARGGGCENYVENGAAGEAGAGGRGEAAGRAGEAGGAGTVTSPAAAYSENAADDAAAAAGAGRAAIVSGSVAGAASAILAAADSTARAVILHELRRFVTPAKSFKFNVVTFGKRIGQREQIARMAQMAFFFPLVSGVDAREFRADLTHADVEFSLFEQYTRRPGEDPPAHELQRVIFGRSLARRGHADELRWWKYRLPARPVLGPTSLDTQLAFLMCNCAHVSPGKIVLDPFVGTGSILIAASAIGAFCLGTDVDLRVLRGWCVSYRNDGARIPESQHAGPPPSGTHAIPADNTVFANFRHYGLSRPDVARCPVAAAVAALATRRAWCDAIVADPPYGIRATVRANDETGAAAVGAVIQDFLTLASRALVAGGRLVFLMPVPDARRTIEDLHLLLATVPACMQLKSAGLQDLSAGTGRALLVFQKSGDVRPPPTVEQRKVRA